VTSRVLLRGGCVLRLTPKAPNLAEGDVLIEDGTIAEVGRGLRARDAEVIDASDSIVMPGFVDTHRHAWASLFRNLGDAAASPSGLRLRAHYDPDDVYAATLIALLGAAEAGITTIVDWSDVSAGDAAAEAALRAHADSGLRTVFVDVGRRETAGGATAVAATRERLGRLRALAGPRTSVAFGVPSLGPGDADADWTAARELGLRVFAHLGGDPITAGSVASLASRGLLGADVTLVHQASFDDADLHAIAGSGAAVSIAPAGEMVRGAGPPAIQGLIDRDIRPGLGVEDDVAAPGDLFAQMRATISVQHAVVFDRKLAGKAGLPRLLSTRNVIRYATVDGARAAGLGDAVGPLEPGRRGDLIVLATDRPNIFPVNDPIGAVVWGMDTSNIVHVLVDGRFLIRDGVHETDRAAAVEAARSARDRVAAAAGLLVAGGVGGRA
jgi:5-methylthioadenosine/S-adenosylhomocysteine deaminase